MNDLDCLHFPTTSSTVPLGTARLWMRYRMHIHCVCRYAGSLIGLGDGIVAVSLIRCRGMVGMEKVGHRQSFCERQLGRSKFQRAKTV